MSNPDDTIREKEIESVTESMATATAPPSESAGDLENQTPPPPLPQTTGRTAEGGFGVAGILQRWKREDMLKRGSLALRGLCLLFSILAFIITVSNKHGPGRNFDEYEEYRYLLAIAILSTLYTGLQCYRQVQELSTGKEMLSRRNSSLLDFSGDQILTYLLISAASSAIPMTNRIREGGDNIFTDSCATAISMEILGFFVLALSSVLNGYKLAKQSYI